MSESRHSAFIDERPQGICVWYRPQVTLLAVPHAVLNGVSFVGEGSPGERLAEFAGRICYMSQKNPAQKSTWEYLRNILSQGHGSVLEHLNISVLVEGVSRSLTHELVRHRAGFAYSQLSQRYVGPDHLAFVMPPLVGKLARGGTGPDAALELESETIAWFHEARSAYVSAIEKLEGLVEQGSMTRAEFRKAVQQTARNVLPNATETKIVVTGNARAWRHVLELRGKAEPEIRRLSVELLDVLREAAPGIFADFVVERAANDGDGYDLQLTCTHHKV